MCIQMQPYVRRVNCNKEHTCQQQLGSLRVWAQRVGSGAPVLASVRRSELQDVEARSIPGHPADTRGKHFYFLPNSCQQGEHGFLIFPYFFQSGAAKISAEGLVNNFGYRGTLLSCRWGDHHPNTEKHKEETASAILLFTEEACSSLTF